MADFTRAVTSANSDEILRQQLFQPIASAPTATAEVRLSADAVQANEAPAESEEEQYESPLNAQEQESLEKAIEQLDELVKPLSIGLSVQQIESLNRMYVQLLDRETGETIREIPPRKILEMQQNIRVFQGLLFDKFS